MCVHCEVVELQRFFEGLLIMIIIINSRLLVGKSEFVGRLVQGDGVAGVWVVRFLDW